MNAQSRKIQSWQFIDFDMPMELREREQSPLANEVLIKVAGCGVCHTDLGFYYERIPTRHELPLTLGHEISGVVVECGENTQDWQGKEVVVPAVIPCGECSACQDGHESICPKQVFPGCDVHGGFADYVVVPARGLCPVPDNSSLDLCEYSVIADAVTTPYQAIVKANLQAGELAVFVGAGGVGGFGVQIAAALGAHVIAVDIDQAKLESLQPHGAHHIINARELDEKSITKEIGAIAKKLNVPTWKWKVFETSGTAVGQSLAFRVVRHGSHLAIVGYANEKICLRLSNLMAFDATVAGNWGCPPEHYPAAVQLVADGKVAISPFIEKRPLSGINQCFIDLKEHKTNKRIILIPEENNGV